MFVEPEIMTDHRLDLSMDEIHANKSRTVNRALHTNYMKLRCFPFHTLQHMVPENEMFHQALQTWPQYKLD